MPEGLADQFELLVAEPQPTLDRLASFLGLAPGSLAAKTLAEDAPSGLGDWKTYGKQGIESASVGRWRTLGPAALALAAPVVNPVLARAGYEPVSAGPAPDPGQAMRRYEITMGLQARRSRTPDGSRTRGSRR